MKQDICRILGAAIFYYVTDLLADDILVIPNDSLVGCASALPPLLGLMWGLPAAFGCTIGALLSEWSDWLILPDIWATGNIVACLWNTVLLFCNCGLWAFIAAYLPWRLWHTLMITPEKTMSTLRAGVVIKFVWVMFITTVTTSVFLALTTNESDMIRLIGNVSNRYGYAFEYALICFVNDFDFVVFFGLPAFFFLSSYDYEFYHPAITKLPSVRLRRTFDVAFVVILAVGIFLCLPEMIKFSGWRLITAILLSAYMLRPLMPPPKIINKHERIIRREEGDTSRPIAAVFYGFLLVLFLVLETSGTIYGLDDMNVWQQFNAECITMMDVALVALFYMLLRYRHSVMTGVVVLEVVTVFVSAFALGAVCFIITDRLTVGNTEDSLAEMSIICRERLKRTFDGIQVSVNDIGDLATAEMESYNRLVTDEAWRKDYLAKCENLFAAIAANTDGSVAFYMRLDPSFAGGLGGFSWGREKNRWEGEAANFYRRRPIDLDKYDPHDYENVGWYYIPVMRHSASWIEPYVDPTIKTYVISYVSPLFSEGKLVGVVGMDIDFDYIIHEVRRMSVYDYGFAYLVGRDGHVLYHRDFAQGAEFVPNPAYREMDTYLTNGIWLGIAMPLKDIYAERNNLLMHLVCVMLTVALIVSCLSISLASRGIRPLVSLTDAAQKIAAGNLDVKLPEESKNELGILVKSMREMVAKLEIYVYRDKLTNLGNTTAYARKCAEMTGVAASNEPYAVMVFDVNYLKKINDTYGHEAGNELIRCAASIIVKVFGNDAAFRIGGDEFAVILEGENYRRRKELMAKFDDLVAAKHFTVGDVQFKLAVARGLAEHHDNLEYSDIFQEADDAMYVHKASLKRQYGDYQR